MKSPIHTGQIGEQVVIRLVISGMYPMRTKSGKWIYFINEAGEYIGTHNPDDFKFYWKDQMFYLGEGQLSEEELVEVRKIDYLLSESYIARFTKWKEKPRTTK